MTGSQAIAYSMNQTSSITNICSTRIYFGNRPDTTIMPCINFYEIPGGQRKWGFEHLSYSINCRAATAETALTLARKVDELFNGLSGTGTYGNANGFSIDRASVRQRQGLIPEPDNVGYNAPVDIFVVFSKDTIS